MKIKNDLTNLNKLELAEITENYDFRDYNRYACYEVYCKDGLCQDCFLGSVRFNLFKKHKDLMNETR